MKRFLRCAWHDGEFLCGAPAPYLIRGTSYCGDHAHPIAQLDYHTGAGRPR